jgi:hypothetical protein
MTTNLNSHDQPPEHAKNQPQLLIPLTLSPKLKLAIENLSVLPEFRAIAREHGEPAMVLEATKLLRQTRPELFDPQTPGDHLARLFADLESENQ